MTAALVFTIVLSFALGVAVGRWWAGLVAAGAWPLLAAGIWLGWWGNGFSADDSALLLAAVFAGLAVTSAVAACTGVLARRANRHLQGAGPRPAPRSPRARQH